jgi:glycosyltransferase involved in cell wall biosynthesis
MSGHSLRILIVAHGFPPMNAIASHRPFSWARTWRDAGHEIDVLTPQKHGFDGPMDLQCDLTGIRIHEVPYLGKRRRSASARTQGTDTHIRRWDRVKTLTRRARFSLAMFGDPRLLAYFPMVRRGLALLREGRFDVIAATSPPEVVFFAARTLSHHTGVPWIADFRDLWFRDTRLFQSHLASSLSGPVNRWLVRDASALVTVSRGLQERLAEYLQRPVLLSYNGFFESESATIEPWMRLDGKMHLVYTGRYYAGRRDPTPLLRALALLRPHVPDLASRLSIDFYGFDDPHLRALVARHRAQDCVVVHGFVPYRQSRAIQCGADILLFLDWTAGKAEGVLTGKLFEYLGSGRPILSIGTRKDTEAARIIRDAGSGVALTETEEIVAYLRELLASGRPRPTDVAKVSLYSRERQARLLLSDLIAVLPPQSASAAAP